MKIKKTLVRLLLLLLMVCCSIQTVFAMEENLVVQMETLNREKVIQIELCDEIVATRATTSFHADISAGSLAGMRDTLFPLEAGETVTINASYSPFSASMDFGLIAPDGYFYYINVNNGSINKTIRVNERGNYMLAVRNNSSSTVSVVGYVNY